MGVPGGEELGMLAAQSGLLRTGLALKLSQIKLAGRSYLRDRTDQVTAAIASYALAAALLAAAAVFLLAACLVGIAALFRWIEINYGLFEAFGVVGALLLVIAAICAAVGARKLKPRKPQFPSLKSRLRVAVQASPLKSGQIEAARDTAAAILAAPPSLVPRTSTRRGRREPGRDNQSLRIGLILAVTLLGWAAVRRRHQKTRVDV
jgi:hypothetical protein